MLHVQMIRIHAQSINQSLARLRQYFYVGSPLLAQVSMGMFFIVSSFCAVEVAEKGSEGITYGTYVGRFVRYVMEEKGRRSSLHVLLCDGREGG